MVGARKGEGEWTIISVPPLRLISDKTCNVKASPNQPLQLTVSSARSWLAPASSSSSGLAFGVLPAAHVSKETCQE